MKQLIKVVLLILVVTLFAPAAYGCFCVRPEFPDAFKKARAVFLGEVVEITEPKTSEPNALLSDRLFRIKFKVKSAWKGVIAGAKEFTVLTGQGRFGCFDFTVGKGQTYMVYADPVFSEEWSFINACNRTTVVTSFSTSPLAWSNGVDAFLDIGQLNRFSATLFSPPLSRTQRCR
jgi:hypothetical protein